MNPYEPSYICEDEIQILIPEGYESYDITNCIITKTSTSQDNKIILTFKNKVEILNITIPEDIINQLYDKMKHNHSLVIYSNYKEIKNLREDDKFNNLIKGHKPKR